MPMSGNTVVVLNAVIAAVTDQTPRLMMVRHAKPVLWKGVPNLLSDMDDDIALPYGLFNPELDRTLELSLRQWVEEQTGMSIGYAEQLYTFGDRYRDPRELAGGPRVISIGYLALGREEPPNGVDHGEWFDWYRFLPWEDWRCGRPDIIDEILIPALEQWANSEPYETIRADRWRRVTTHFGHDDAAWNFEQVLERYEILYEAGLVAESERDRLARAQFINTPGPNPSASAAIIATGSSATLDHRRMMATALARIRGKLKYRPVVFELLPPTFTLLQLQQVIESLSGVNLHKQNFRRLVINNKLVEPTGALDAQGPGRPAKEFRFRTDVLRERQAPGVALPLATS
ncbi:MAG: NUDIX hydrolase [Alphaproteobacteria bacterium]|jgi:hypothetical protein